MQSQTKKPENTQDIVKHLGDVDYPVTGRQFIEACNNMSDVPKEQNDWVKQNIDVNKTYNSPNEIRQALKI